MFNIDFKSEDSIFLYHERMSEVVPIIKEGLKDIKDHFFLFSSGTTSNTPKGYAISKTALLNNAKAVNEFFNLTSDDIWGLSLPHYHIGGLSVLARAHLTNSKVIILNSKWDPLTWRDSLDKHKITITTIVPTQLYDLVKNKIEAPKDLRFIVVGGDYLSEDLYKEGLKLGWPVIKTFGMSEVSSQLASSKSKDNDELIIFPIHKVKTDSNNRLWVKSESLYTLEFRYENNRLTTTYAHTLFDDEGYYPTQDKVKIEDDKFIHLGRLNDEIKIKGRLTSFIELKEKLYAYTLKNNLYGHVEILLKDDHREGKILEVLFDTEINEDEIRKVLKPASLNFRRITKFKKTDLGKIKLNN